MTVAVLLWFMVSYAQKAPQAFLERYDLSTTVINPDTAPTVPGHYIYAHAFNYDLQGKHLDTLTAHKLQWSFLYRDGHTDTWEFYR